MKKGTSISTKLVRIFVLVLLCVFIVNMAIFIVQNRAVRQIDNVYNSSIELNELSETLNHIQNSLYRYLSTRSSAELEKYYTFEQEYRTMLEGLNREVSDSSRLLSEKNIYYMSQSYLEVTKDAVGDKRRRNISGYKEKYAASCRICNDLQANIDYLNNAVFLENSKNYSVIRTTLYQMTKGSFLFLLFIMFLALVWLVAKTRGIIRPLTELADAANLIAKGNRNVSFPIVETNDETATVAKACNEMMDSIRQYIQEIRENYERESRMRENELAMKNDLKEAQLKYLQAQIDPHFLFNSLNAGAQLAMMEGAERACLYIENLADFFRYNVRKMDKTTTVREETELVDHYLYILNVRFSGDIHYEKQIDERLWEVEMPGMILQPVVENAVKHGIGEMEGRGKIHLSVWSEGNLVNIRIQDNGKGIDPETAERIVRGENVNGDGMDNTSAGIGLDNVISRLRRYYSREHVIDISRRAEGGTEVVLHILKRKEGGSDDKDLNM